MAVILYYYLGAETYIILGTEGNHIRTAMFLSKTEAGGIYTVQAKGRRHHTGAF